MAAAKPLSKAMQQRKDKYDKEVVDLPPGRHFLPLNASLSLGGGLPGKGSDASATPAQLAACSELGTVIVSSLHPRQLE